MAKIAVELDRALARRQQLGTQGCAEARVVARGEGWTVADVMCTSGPRDRPFEEQHSNYSLAMVLAGTFQYRSSLGHVVMSPGSVMLGNPELCYECGHEHAEGDRCVAFWFTPEYFERLAADAGIRGPLNFKVPRLASSRPLARLAADASTGVAGSDAIAWDELAVRLAVHAVRAGRGAAHESRTPPIATTARITRTVRAIERHPEAPHTLADLARLAGLSPYHFLRTFEQATGVTPHQFVRRARLREAAVRLATESGSVLDIALDCGFGDVSNFNRAFREEFTVTPRERRRRASPGGLSAACAGRGR